jgi:hypothetical protein
MKCVKKVKIVNLKFSINSKQTTGYYPSYVYFHGGCQRSIILENGSSCKTPDNCKKSLNFYVYCSSILDGIWYSARLIAPEFNRTINKRQRRTCLDYLKSHAEKTAVSKVTPISVTCGGTLQHVIQADHKKDPFVSCFSTAICIF